MVNNKPNEVRGLINLVILLLLLMVLMFMAGLTVIFGWLSLSSFEVITSSLIFMFKVMSILILLVIFVKIRIKIMKLKFFLKENIIQLIFLTIFYVVFSLYLVRSTWMSINVFFPSYIIRYEPYLVSIKLYGIVVFTLFFIRLLPSLRYLEIHTFLKLNVDKKMKNYLVKMIEPATRYKESFLDLIQHIMIGVIIGFVFLTSLAVRLGAKYNGEFFQDFTVYNIIILLCVIFLEFLFWYLIPKFQKSKLYSKLIREQSEDYKIKTTEVEYKSLREVYPRFYTFLKKYFPFLFRDKFWKCVQVTFIMVACILIMLVISVIVTMIKSQQDKINVSIMIYVHSYNITLTQDETSYGPIQLVKYEDGVVYSFNPQIISSVKEISNTNQYLNVKESLIPIQISVEITRKNNGYVNLPREFHQPLGCG